MTPNEFILTEATMKELDIAVDEIEAIKGELGPIVRPCNRSIEIILAALNQVREAREMYGEEELNE